MKRKTSASKIRLTIDLPVHEGEVLERMAEFTGGTRTEIIKRAIALMDTALAAKARGRTLAVASGDKLVSTIIL